MPVNLKWADLRGINGSQQKGFEKLCVQLARQEITEEGPVPIPVGDPDAGVEYYWLYPDGTEWGWQAKFFTRAPQNPEWQQISRSVKKALDKHPNLVRYTVCLPVDLPDAREGKRTSSREKWTAYKAKWEEIATAKGMEVNFEYWGETEIIERLGREENRGRIYFWFSRDLVFSNNWLERRLNENLENVGPRYTKEINVDLPIAGLFDELGRTPIFFSKITGLVVEIKKAFKRVDEKNANVVFPEEYRTISRIVGELGQSENRGNWRARNGATETDEPKRGH